MKKKYIHVIVLALTILFGYSCAEDKGNYSYVDINEVIISGIKDSYDIEMESTLSIKPSLEFTLPENNDKFKYEWYYLKGSIKTGITWTVDEEILVHEGTDIDIDIARPDFTKSDIYKYAFKITNEVTGVEYVKKFEINVSLPYYIGYASICEKENGFDLDMVGYYNGEFDLHNDILKLCNTDIQLQGAKPLGLAAYEDANSLTIAANGYAFIVMSDKASSRLDPVDYTYNPKHALDNLIFAPEEYLVDGTLTFQKMISTSKTSAYGYMNKNWFYYTGSGSRTYFFSYPINRLKVGNKEFERVDVSDKIAITGPGSLLFDTANRRFIFNKSSSSTDPNDVFVSELLRDSVHHSFKWNQPDIDLIHLDNYRAIVGSTITQFIYIIVKDRLSNKGQIWIVSVASGGLPYKREIKTFANTDINNAKSVAMTPDSKYWYYATEDNIYCTHNETMADINLGTGILPAGHKISKLKFVTFNDRTLLALATYDPNGTIGSNGTLQLFDFDDNGKLSLAKHPKEAGGDIIQKNMSWSGFGKIVDLVAKLK